MRCCINKVLALYLFRAIILFASFSIPTPVWAQITPDRTVNTQVNETGNVFEIGDGTISGSNLFHSFIEFSLPAEAEAFFNNPTNIDNIISRVTGGSISNIDGLIRANGHANLLLINPNGIIFGPNASLNIGGSFLGSTAERVKFADGTEFSATDTGQAPLLTISVPLGLQFGEYPAPIVHQQAALQVSSGQTLALVGGGLSLVGGNLSTEGGRIELGSVGSNSTVSLTPLEAGWNLDYETVGNFQDIELNQAASINTSAEGGGSIEIVGETIALREGTAIVADTLGQLDGGQIGIVADSVLLESALISTETTNGGNGGNITVEAANAIALSNGSGMSSSTSSTGDAGQVELTARSILLDNSGLGSNTTSSGDAGRVSLTAESIVARNRGGAGTNTRGEGNAGQIDITADSILIENQSGFGSDTFSKGNAGTINITAGDFVIRNDSGMGSHTESEGNAGQINVTANFLLVENESGFGSDSRVGSTGNAGQITVIADIVVLRNSGISSNTFSTGNAGNLVVRVGELILDDDGKLEIQSSGTGNAGNLLVQADLIAIDNQSSINASTSSGEGGNISSQVKDLLFLNNNSEISAEAGGTGNGGNIRINANLVIALGNSDIIANAFEGKGGKIQINTQGIFGTEARTELTPESDITATSALGPQFDGIVEINTPDIDPKNGLLGFPNKVVRIPHIETSCGGIGYSKDNRFVVVGKGGVPYTPDDLGLGTRVLQDLGTLDTPITDSPAVTRSTVPEPPRQLIEANGWIVNEDGNIELVALMANATSSWYNGPSCDLGLTSDQ